jgi:WD40 repeat protein
MRPRHAPRVTPFARACALIGLASWLSSAPCIRASPPLLVPMAGPDESVTSVSFSPDGKLAASGSFDGRIRIYDPGSGAMLRAIGTERNSGIRSLAFSPDGRALATAGYHMDKRIPICDPATGRLIRTLAGHSEIETYAVAFSPGGKWLASAGSDRGILVWDLGSEGPPRRLGEEAGLAIALAFSPDGKALAGGGEGGKVHLWDPESGRLLRSLEGHRDWACALAFSPDGKSLASGETDWGYHRGRDPSRFSEPERKSDGAVRIWDLDSGAAGRTIRTPGRLSGLAFSPDGRSLACAVGDSVRSYNLADGKGDGEVIATHDAPATSVAYAPDGKSILSGGHDRSAKLTSLPKRALRWQRNGYWDQVNAVALSPDGSMMAAGSGDLRFAERKLAADASGIGMGGLRLWDPKEGGLLARIGDPREQVSSVAFSPDGRLIASSGGCPSGSGIIRVREAGSGELSWKRLDHERDVPAILFTPDGKGLVSGGVDGLIHLRDAATGSVIRTFRGHDGEVTSLTIARDGSLLASGGADLSVRLWDPATGKPIRTIPPGGGRGKGDGRAITAVALSPDGGSLAITAGGEPASSGIRSVGIWDVRTGEKKLELGRPQSRNRLAAFSPDGAILASSGVGKSIALWDLKSGRFLRELVGHPHPPLSAAFSPDGRALFSAGEYHAVKAWDVATGEPLASLATFFEGSPRSEHWLTIALDGTYDGSPGVERFLSWRVGAELLGADRMAGGLRRPDRLKELLQPRR